MPLEDLTKDNKEEFMTGRIMARDFAYISSIMLGEGNAVDKHQEFVSYIEEVLSEDVPPLFRPEYKNLLCTYFNNLMRHPKKVRSNL
ncbi:MAG TPA: hypothetical protein PLK34_00050 [Candidatus Pacearchaeota archaeon]|nr:hypothetical protein [Candidatus Pacearchaeota archaeon]